MSEAKQSKRKSSEVKRSKRKTSKRSEAKQNEVCERSKRMSCERSDFDSEASDFVMICYPHE